jgi:hypothetical protein
MVLGALIALAAGVVVAIWGKQIQAWLDERREHPS